MEWWGWLIILAAVVVVIMIISWIVGVYNKLVASKQRVKNGWSQIDVQLKKRYDLIPNLVETVKGYAKHEKETLENVVMWRSKATSATTAAESMEANAGLSGALSRLLVTVEKYPELKANTNFLKMQDDLKEIENKIAMARQFYNDTVQRNNMLIQQFPSNIIAGMFHFELAKYFEVDDSVRQNAPKVTF